MSHPERSERLIDEHEAATWITDGMTIAIGDPAPMAMIPETTRPKSGSLRGPVSLARLRGAR